MSGGIFSQWQPRYAERGIPTFPVRKDKTPGVKNWGKLGLGGSKQLAEQERFHTSEALGFPLGPRTKLVIVDVDTKDPAILNDVESRFGKAEFAVETAGGYHAYYAHRGERRLIRPFGADVPIDILGNGYAVGAPSLTLKGPYNIIRGTLESLNSLPPMYAVLDDLRRQSIPEGKRNTSMFHIGLKHAAHADDFDTFLDVMRTRNMDCETPMPDAELLKAASSAWKYEQEGRNLVGRGKAFVISHDLFDRIEAHSPDAFRLLMRLKRHHWGRDFILSRPMARSMGWDHRRWNKARDLLVRFGIIACLHEGGRGPGDPPIYGWADDRKWGLNV
jgi:hypothetical protein